MNGLISIIIASKNSSRYLSQALDSIKKLNYDPYEVIVVNDGSTDNTDEVLLKYPEVKAIKTQGVGPSAARNLALKEAKGEYIAFTDADCIVHEDWLIELLKGFTPGHLPLDPVVGVGGGQQSPQDETKFGRKVQEFLKSIGFTADYVKDTDSIVETKHNPTCNVMYKKSVLDEAGGFLEGLWPGEDLEIDYRLIRKGYKLKFNPKAIVYHYRPETSKKFNKMMLNYGRAQGFLVKRYGPFRFIHFVPLIIMAFLAFSMTLGILLFFLAASFYFVFKTRDLSKGMYFVWLLVKTLVFWNIGFLQELVSSRFKTAKAGNL